MALVQSVGHAVVGVQAVGIQNDRKLRLPDDQPDELLRFVLHGKPGADGENGFAAQDLRETCRSRDCAGSRCRLRWTARGAVIISGIPAATIGQHVLRRGHGDESRSGAQRAARRTESPRRISRAIRPRSARGRTFPYSRPGRARAARREIPPARSSEFSNASRTRAAPAASRYLSRPARRSTTSAAKRAAPPWARSSVTVKSAATTGPPKSCASEASPEGISTATTTVLPRRFRPRRVQIFDDRAQQAFHGPAQPGAEQRVHDQVRFSQRRARRFPFRLARHDVQFAETLLPALQIRRGIALDRARIRKEKNDRREHQNLSAAWRPPGRRRRYFPSRTAPGFCGCAMSGNFSRRNSAIAVPAFSINSQAGNAVPLRGEPVGLAHLCRGQNFHARFSCGVRRKSA